MDFLTQLLIFVVIIAIAVLLFRYFAPGAVHLFSGGFSGGAQTMRIFTQEPWYTEIAEGRKKVEARVGDAEKYKPLIGKTVQIVSPGKKVKVIVEGVRHYADLDSYLAKEGWKKVAPHVKTEADAKAAYLSIKDKSGQSIYAPERVKEKGGIVALEIKLT